MEVNPEAPPHIPCEPLLEAIWYFRVRQRENIFRKNHYYGIEGGVCTNLTHGHTKLAHISHIFSGAEPPAPCQTGLPCTRSQTWNSISRAPNSHVKTAYPVRTFTQLTAKPPPPRPSSLKALSAYPTVPRPYHLAPSLALRGLFPTLSVISLRSAVLRSPWWEIGAKIRLTLSGSWQQGHSTAYRTVSHS